MALAHSASSGPSQRWSCACLPPRGMFRTLLNQRRDGEGYREMVRASSDLSVGDGWPGVDWRGALLGGGWERCIWEGKRAGVDMKEPVLGAGLAGAERCRHGACVLACLDWEGLRRKLLTVFNTLIDVRLPEKLAATVIRCTVLKFATNETFDLYYLLDDC
jgi:hypothetical protein